MKDIVLQPGRRHAKLLACLALFALGALVYANAFSNSFHFDDIYGIVRNPALRNPANIPSYFTDVRTFGLAGARDWRPVLLVTYALDYARAGLDPAAFRTTNFLLHVGSACLIYLTVLMMLESGRAGDRRSPEAAAFFAAALFIVHTVNTEAVDYISSRSSVLTAFFYLLAFYCFLRGFWGGMKRPAVWQAAGVAAFALGLGAKATAVTLPAALIVYEALFYGDGTLLELYRREPKRLLKYLPLAVVCVAYIAFRFVYLRGFFRRVVSSGELSGVTAWTYLLTQFRAWVYYLKLFIWPDPLITDFPGFGWSHRISEPAVLWSIVIIAVILALAWSVRATYPMVTFFTLWFFIALLPEASFLPLLDPVTGYRAYLAYVGPSVISTYAIFAAASWAAERIGGVSAARLSGAAMAVILIALIAATAQRNRAWSDETTLWSDVVAKDPTNVRAYVNLALQYIEMKDYTRADALLHAAVERAPKNAYVLMMRGYLRYVLEKDDRGVADFTAAIHLEPRQPMPYYYRGEAYRRLGAYDKALADYAAAVDRQPFYADAYMGIALVRMDQGDKDAAIAACDKIVAIDPRDARGYNCLGILLLEQNRIPDALRIYQKGVIHAPRDSGLWYGLGLAYEKSNMFQEAGDAFARSAELVR